MNDQPYKVQSEWSSRRYCLEKEFLHYSRQKMKKEKGLLQNHLSAIKQKQTRGSGQIIKSDRPKCNSGIAQKFKQQLGECMNDVLQFEKNPYIVPNVEFK